MKRLLPLFGILLIGAAVPPRTQQPEATPETKAASKPEEAQVLLDAALKKSKQQKKPVLVIFDASW